MFRSLSLAAPVGALLLALLGGTLGGCDSADAPTGPVAVRLDVEAFAGGAAFRAGQPFTVDGRTGQLDVARFYLSGLTLLHEDGREIAVIADAPVTVRAQDESGAEIQHAVDERYVLVDAAARVPVALGEVPAGRYTGMRFTLGVDGLDNRAATEDFPAGHPLAPQEPSMHWSWNSGYVFLRLDGLLDVDGDGVVDASTGTPGDPASGQWRLHLGLTANATTVTLAEPFTLDADETQSLHLQVDLARFVQGIDYAVPANRFCMTGGCTPVVDQAKANVLAAFTFHGVRHERDS